MTTRTYWLDLFTGTTWQEFLAAGSTVSGFRERRWNTVQQMKPGDYLLCYLTGVSRWVGVLEVTSDAFMDRSPIWHDEFFPCRVRVKPVLSLTAETGVPVVEMRDQLSVFQNLVSPFAWTGYFRGSPAKWKVSDGEAVINAVKEAHQNPVVRPVNAAKLARKPRALHADRLGEVTIPERDDVAVEAPAVTTQTEEARVTSLHTEVQGMLLKFGSDMGFDVWVARNDRGRGTDGQAFVDIPRMRSTLPRLFNEATDRTVALIDVLWLKSNAIVAAFEIECTTSIYSGLLRMSDLIAMQPNLNIQLYLVAQDERRDKVMTEVNRPTFSSLQPPLNEMCRFLSIETLRDRLAQLASVVRFLRPEFLQEISESCELEEV